MPESVQRAWGVMRRFALSHFKRSYVEEQARKRQGECRRCGDCCRIIVRCPFLKGRNHCVIYNKRSAQCKMFPIDERDLRDVPTCVFRFNGAAQEHDDDSGAPGSVSAP